MSNLLILCILIVRLRIIKLRVSGDKNNNLRKISNLPRWMEQMAGLSRNIQRCLYMIVEGNTRRGT